MTKYICVPIFLFPDDSLKFTRCEVVPGVRVQRISKSLTDIFRKVNENIPEGSRPDFFPSHVIMIELQKHFEYLTVLFAREKIVIPRHPYEDKFERSELFVDTSSVIRHVVMTLVLTCGIQFRVGGSIRLDEILVGKTRKYVWRGYSHHYSEGSYLQNSLVWNNFANTANVRSLKKTAERLQRYYRSYSWWDDRLGMALGHLWNALCSRYGDQSFVGLSMALEAILSTGRDEITHKIAERVAMILETDSKKRNETYEMVKKFYGTRSKLVHGAARPKKGSLTTESLAIGAKHTLVPESQGKSLFRLVVLVLNALLEDRTYLSIVYNTKSEDKTDKKIDELFVRRILGAAD